MASDDVVKGPYDTPKTILVMVDTVEAAVILDALATYRKGLKGPVEAMCQNLEAGFSGALKD